MMGPMKAAEIRAELRKAFKMSDADLGISFQGQIESQARRPGDRKTAIETLELLRDALIKEVKRSPARRSKRRVASGVKR
jgi:hypothetical protein